MVENILLLLNSEPVRLLPFLCIKIKNSFFIVEPFTGAANI